MSTSPPNKPRGLKVILLLLAIAVCLILFADKLPRSAVDTHYEPYIDPEARYKAVKTLYDAVYNERARNAVNRYRQGWRDAPN